MDISTTIGASAGLAWLLVIGVVILAVLRASRGTRLGSSSALIVSTIILAIVLTTISQSLVFVQPQNRGVVISAIPGRGGVRPNALLGGLSWIVPYFENVVTYDVSRKTYTMSSTDSEEQQLSVGDDAVEARTKDGQIVYVDASVIFQIDPARVVDVHLFWQNNYLNDLIRPQARGIIRDAVAIYNIEDVYSIQRVAVTQIMATEMATVLEEGGFLLIDFVLRNIAFSPEYAVSVEQKQIAEQEALRAEFVVQQREQEANQARAVAQGEADSEAIRAEGQARATVIRAQAEADARLIQAEAEATALAMLGEAIAANPDVLILEYIEKLSDNISVMLLPADNPFLFPLPDIGPPDPIPTNTPAPTPTVEPSPEPPSTP
jgi:regulator of protease activity HflC (stomatin/prohibitin superfamily)